VYPVRLIRWAGLLAVISGMLFAAVDFFDLLDLAFSNESDSEAITTLSEQTDSILAPVANVLLLLGLVGLYAAQSEAAGTSGLAGFLLAFCGGVLGHHSSVSWPYWLSALAWAIFGVSALQAQVFPRLPAILLTISAVLTGILSDSFPGSILTYVSALSFLVFDVAVSWLGFNLFAGRLRDARLVDLYESLRDVQKNLNQERKRVKQLMAERNETEQKLQTMRERVVVCVAAVLLVYYRQRRRSIE
jgi:hypothetical protein